MEPHSRGYWAGLHQDAGGEALQMNSIAFLYHNHIFTELRILAFLVASYGYVTKFWQIKFEWKVHALLPGLVCKRNTCASLGHFPGN